MSDLTAIIADRAAGNPFFAEEMVRELAQRGVLAGERGDYRCRGDVSEVTVPATVQAAIAARIDRLDPAARHTLNAASVIGQRFSADLLAALDVDAEFAELLNTELIDQVQFTPAAEYAFHHPLIRAVAYEAQLKSGRSEWHRRLAAAIEQSAPDSVEENAALIAEHLDSAGDLHAAYGWQMRAAAWSVKRDIVAARLCWQRAFRIAKRIPEDGPAELSMRIAPLTMLCASDFHAGAAEESRGRFTELRDLCSAAGDKVSLAIGMTGLVTEYLYARRGGEAARLASEQMALLESIGDSTLTVGLGFVAFASWFNTANSTRSCGGRRRSSTWPPAMPPRAPNSDSASPLSVAMAFRGIARWWLGQSRMARRPRDALAMAQELRPGDAGVHSRLDLRSRDRLWGAPCRRFRVTSKRRGDAKPHERTGNDNAVTLCEYGLGSSCCIGRTRLTGGVGWS